MFQTDALMQVSWRCIHFAAADDVTLAARQRLEAAGLALFDLRGDAARSDRELLQRLGEAMDFPDYYGGNWDAAEECLRDLDEWRPAPGYVLFIHDADRLWRHCPRPAGMLVESWLGAAEAWSRQAVPFHLVFLEDGVPADAA